MMLNKISFLFPVFSILFCIESAGQNILSPGYIVNTLDDTIRGKIVDRDWSLSPGKIEFVKNNKTASIKYTPSEIKAFGVNGRYDYISRIVIVDVSNFRTNELNYSPVPDTMTQHLFLKVLVKGKINLYYNKDEKEKEHFFISKESPSITELILKKYMSENEPNKIRVVEKFRNQLSFMMADCAAINEKIKVVRFTVNDLVNLVLVYNNCVNPVYNTYEFKSKPAKISFGILAGLTSSSLSFSGIANPVMLASADFKSYIGFTFGGNFILPLEKHFGRHNLLLELMYKKIHFATTFDTVVINYIGYDIKYKYEYNIQYSYVKLNILYRLILAPKEHSEFFIDLGFSNSFVLQSEHNYLEKRTNLFNNSTSESSGDLFGEPHQFQHSLLAGIGITINHVYSAKIGYERESQLSNYSYLGSTVNTYLLIFNYFFSH